MRDLKKLVEAQPPVLFDTDKLVPYENNVKNHPPEQVDVIATSISRFGWRGSPIIIDENNVIINGHGRRLAALKIGLPQVPVVVVKGLSEEEKKSLRLADNRSAVSDYDTDALQREIESINASIDVNDMLGGIYSAKELGFLNADLGEMDLGVFRTDVDEVVDEMKGHVDSNINEAEEREIPIAKVMGFRSISSRYVPAVEQFIESITGDGQDAAEAFGEFCKRSMGE